MFSHKKQKSYELRLARVCLASPSLWLKFNPTLNLSAALATVWMLKVKLKKSKYFVVSCADGCHIGNLNESFFIVFQTLETSFYIEQQHFPPPLCVSPRRSLIIMFVSFCAVYSVNQTTGKSPAVVSTAVTVVLLSVGGKSKCCSWKLTLQTSQNRNQMESRA